MWFFTQFHFFVPIPEVKKSGKSQSLRKQKPSFCQKQFQKLKKWSIGEKKFWSFFILRSIIGVLFSENIKIQVFIRWSVGNDSTNFYLAKTDQPSELNELPYDTQKKLNGHLNRRKFIIRL